MSTQPTRQFTSLPIDYDKRLMLFAGRANPELGASIADLLGVRLGALSLETLSSGEVYCRYEESIRGSDIFIVQPLCANPTLELSINDAFAELLAMLDAAAGASAHRIIAVVPWIAYARQDRKLRPREPISARFVARSLEAAGVDQIITVDMHSRQIEGLFQVVVDHLSALRIVATHFEGLRLPDLVVVAPETDSVKRCKRLATALDAEMAIIARDGDDERPAALSDLVGEVAGRSTLIWDDIIDTGHTMCAAAKLVRELGAVRVYAAATHPLLSGPACAALVDADFDEIVVTDTIPLHIGAPSILRVLSCAGLLTDAIRRVFTGDSVSELLGG